MQVRLGVEMETDTGQRGLLKLAQWLRWPGVDTGRRAGGAWGGSQGCVPATHGASQA